MPNATFEYTHRGSKVLIDAFADWGIILQPRTRRMPKPKIERVEVPGRNGRVDVTNAIGETTYDDIEASLIFKKLDTSRSWATVKSMIANSIHGKACKVRFDDEPSYYYDARVTFHEQDSDENIGMFTIDFVAFPFKLKDEPTVIAVEVNGSATKQLVNDRMTALPKITTTAAMQLEVEGKTFAMNESGSYTFPDFLLFEGITEIELTGTGAVTFEWQEGSL